MNLHGARATGVLVSALHVVLVCLGATYFGGIHLAAGPLGGIRLGIGALAADEINPFDALRTGEVRRSRRSGLRLSVAGSETVLVGPGGRFELEGTPRGLPVTLRIQGDPEAAASAPFGLEVTGIGASGAAGSRTLVLPPTGARTQVSVHGETAGGAVLPEANTLLGTPALRVASTAPEVAVVSDGGEVTAGAPGHAWVQVLSGEEVAQVLLQVDAAVDSDGDGLPDVWELAHGLDPLSRFDALRDADNDRLNHLEEFRRGTDPNAFDSDGDLLGDGDEVLNQLTDPFDSDTDGDGVSDRTELVAGSDPLNPNDRPAALFQPALVANRALSATGLRLAASADDHFFVAGDGGLLTAYRFDSSTRSIIFLDSEVLGGTLFDVCVGDGRVYVAAGSDGIHVGDLENAANLERLDTVGSLGAVLGVVFHRGFLYAASSEGLHVLEPTSPEGGAGSLSHVTTLDLPPFARLAASGPRLYAGLSLPSELVIIDIRDPGDPLELGRATLPVSASPFQAIVASGDMAYVAHGAAGLLAISTADPLAPAIVDSSSADLGTASILELSRVGDLLVGHTPSSNGAVQVWRLQDNGEFFFQGEVEANSGGVQQLVGNQNYVIALAPSSFSVSEVTAAADRGSQAPGGTLIVETRPPGTIPSEPAGEASFAPGMTVVLRARSFDDVFVDAVDFWVEGKLHTTDTVAPFRVAVSTDLGSELPSDGAASLEVHAVARDLRGAEGDSGAQRIVIELDLDGDGLPDLRDPDRDGDGLSNIEEEFAGEDGFVSDPDLVDSDGDGIDDGEETRLGLDGFITDPSSADTDNDGLRDGFELTATGSHPARADSDGDGQADGEEDGDGDGLDARSEALLGSSPTNPDSDGDGVPDGIEADLGLDPTRADSDGDGLVDGAEDGDGDGLDNAAELAAETDPRRPDSDGDGFDDGTEVFLGTDPAAVSDFSDREIAFTGRTVVLHAPVSISSLSLVESLVTVPLPAVDAAGVLRFTSLDLEVRGELAVDARSLIDVSARGYAGGRSEGNPSAFGLGPAGVPTGDDFSGGSHGGHGGVGSEGVRGELPQDPFGDFQRPRSAGGGGSVSADTGIRGGTGGGVLHLRAGRIVLEGGILADGEGVGGSGGGGAGGSVWIECERISGTGIVAARGANSFRPGGKSPGGGGGGRIAISATEVLEIEATQVLAHGGRLVGPELPVPVGAAGTVLLTSPLGRELVVDNAGREAVAARTLLADPLRGVVTAVDVETLTRFEGRPAADVVGLELDENADDEVLDTLEVIAVDGARLVMAGEPQAEPGDIISTVYRLDRIVVRGQGRLATDATLVLPTLAAADNGAPAPLEIEAGSEAVLANVFALEDDDFDLDGGTVEIERLRGPGGGFDQLRLLEANLLVHQNLDAVRILLESSRLQLGAPLVCGLLELRDSILTVPEPSVGVFYPLDLFVTDTLTVDAASSIDLAGKGYVGARREGNTEAFGISADFSPAAIEGSGGSHGGEGGLPLPAEASADVWRTFDDFTAPRRPGAGGSAYLADTARGYHGGGLVLLEAGELVLEGVLSVDGDGQQRFDSGEGGSDEDGAAGAGGGIYLRLGVLRGGGEIRADGGFAKAGGGADGAACGGGGGRVAIEFMERGEFNGTVHAFGGGWLPEGVVAECAGAAGTVFWRAEETIHGDLIVDGGGRPRGGARTALRALGAGTVTGLTTRQLDGDVAFVASDTGYEGQWVVVAGDVGAAFRIVGNNEAVLFTDPRRNLRTVGAVGDSFQGALNLRSLTVTGGAHFDTRAGWIILNGGPLEVSGDSELETPRVEER